MTDDQETRRRRVRAERLDDFDEELELELDDVGSDAIADFMADQGQPDPEGKLSRRRYFGELFRLQAELVKLQDWVVHEGLKIVVLFEGRDAAGKGGTIKRVTQRLNPRVCRTVALPAPSDREKTQWYTSSATCRTCQRRAKSCCSIAVGTIGPASSG